MEGATGEISRFGSLAGASGLFVRILLIAIPVAGFVFIIDIPGYLGRPVIIEQYLGLFIALVLGTVFLMFPATGKHPRNRVPWYDWILSSLGFVVGLNVTFFYPRILLSIIFTTPGRSILGFIAILLILEGARRVVGWVMVVFGAVFIFYAHFSYLFPGVFYSPGVPWNVLGSYLYLDRNGLIGIPIKITAAVILAFILLGNMLFATGAGKALTDLSLAIFGRFRGGPAKMAVVASSLFGTINGSAVANVATTGVLTIPLMMRSGYKPHLAGAIEAVASTGGQMMPPIMGATAFVMAFFLGVPYAQVVIAAILPAVLYYLVIFIQVHLEAAKYGLEGLPREELPRLREGLRLSWLFLIPLLVLIYFLFIRAFEPGKAGLIAVLAILILSQFRRQLRFHLSWLGQALEATGRTMLEIGVVVAVAGLVIGVINISGLGVTIPRFVNSLAGGNIFLLLFILGVASIIMGMGLPTMSLYILLSILIAPSLVMLGIEPMAAHLFILYFGMLSMITPPIAFASFTAAAIAQSDGMRTGYAGMRLGAVAYIIPFLFVLSPALLLNGSLTEIILVAVTAIAGCFLLSVGLVGYLVREMNWVKRGLLILAGVGLLIPAQGMFATAGLISDIGGVFLAVAVFLVELLPRWLPREVAPRHL